MRMSLIPLRKASIAQILRGWSALALLLSCAMALVILNGTYKAALQARQDIAIIREVFLVLNAGHLIAAERASANVLMAEAGHTSNESWEGVYNARHKVDMALNQVSAITPPSSFTSLRRHIRQARQCTDSVANQESFSSQDISESVKNFFSVSDDFKAIIMKKMATDWAGMDPSLQGPVLRAITLYNLRDTSGRLGSLLVPWLAVNLPISPESLEIINNTDEQIKQLWQFLETVRATPETTLSRLESEARNHYFLEGRPLIQLIIKEGNGKIPSYPRTVLDMTQHYSESISFIDPWQSAYLNRILFVYEERAKYDTGLFVIVLVAILVTIILIIGSVYLVNARILKPLLDASQVVVSMAEGSILAVKEDRKRSHELRQLFEALDVLQIRLRERESLMFTLKTMAETDGLTGLMNRNTFESTGAAWLVTSIDELPIFLILMDLDHFKLVNDRYGHPIGDEVLKAVSNVLLDSVRSCDIVARLGGEEFGVLLRAAAISDAICLAERIRSALHSLNVNTYSGDLIKVTISVGIAQANGTAWQLLVTYADRALYQAKHDGRNCIRVARM